MKSFESPFLPSGYLRQDGLPFSVAITETQNKWPGMHPYIRDHFNNRFQGTLTHYDTLPSATRAVKGFTDPKNPRKFSTHFVIARDGTVHQLASIHDRTWHGAFKHVNGESVEWTDNGGRMPLPNGESMSNPNHWLVGIDFSNFGWLTKSGSPSSPVYKSWTGQEIPQYNVYTEYETTGARAKLGFPRPKGYWEDYTLKAITSYSFLMRFLIEELNIPENMHFRHSDTSPTRKVDPGPALPFHQIINRVYNDIAFAASHESYDLDPAGPFDVC